MLHVYRQILKAARFFPSVKRDRIIAEIKHEFRMKKVGRQEQHNLYPAHAPLALQLALPVFGSHSASADESLAAKSITVSSCHLYHQDLMAGARNV